MMMMMMMVKGHLALLLTGVSMAIQIHQSPPALLKEAGGDVQLVCSHQQSDFRVMLWYQQPPGGGAMKLVGHGYVEFREDAVEEAFRGDFSLAGELGGDGRKNASLFIRNLRAPEHAATVAPPPFEVNITSCLFLSRASSSSLTFTMKPSPLLLLLLFWIRGGRASPDKVSQTPSSVLVEAGREVTLTLSHTISSYDTILWYRRPPGVAALTLMAYMYYNTPNYEPGFKNCVIVTGNGESKVDLQLLNVSHHQSAGEYFGAASRHSTEEEGRRRTKTLREDDKPTGNLRHVQKALTLQNVEFRRFTE
ncbi:hypothetical protein OJAV_G00217340 [Oryzias javanicus]|uniref:Immunoglobulin V-set domain-containing protein n=1 Tax=Oryzias javanicus TaxID=123683 RepID=A0A437C4F4_ORYJA|nr:hypothetical protein OJAV_G00217340 [Oryzias javanicus]